MPSTSVPVVHLDANQHDEQQLSATACRTDCVKAQHLDTAGGGHALSPIFLCPCALPGTLPLKQLKKSRYRAGCSGVRGGRPAGAGPGDDTGKLPARGARRGFDDRGRGDACTAAARHPG